MRADVTAVLVVSSGSRRSPEVLEALAASTARPARLVCVDTRGADAASGPLSGTAVPVRQLPRGTALPTALAAALSEQPCSGWVWLLHDDVVPERGALEALLSCAAARPDAALLGPAIVDADDPRRLLELGLTVDGAGRRRTGVEPGELDQGQHDAVREVLAVSTAGALVRRDVWDALGGLDPTLPPGCDDIDLGWRVCAAGSRVLAVPAARVRRAQRPAGDVPRALPVRLAHASAAALLPVLLRCVLGALLRAAGRLLTRQPRAAAVELRALAVLTRPAELHAARRRRRATRVLPPSAVRPLLARSGPSVRACLVDTAERLAGADRRPSRPALRERPGLLLVAALAVLALGAQRDLLGAGPLSGGALLPAPDSAVALWASYAGPDGGPHLALLALLATVLAGSASLAVDLVLLACVPLAGAAAWSASAGAVRAPALRAWLAVTWALLPVTTGAASGGRLDTAVAAVALPWLLARGWAVLADDPRDDGWRRTWSLALVLTVTCAFAPALWPPAAVLLLVPALIVVATGPHRQRDCALRRLGACATALAAPCVVLLPWTWVTAGALLGGPGLPAGGTDLPAGHLLLGGGLLLGAAAALLGSERPRLAVGAWSVALVGLVHALVLVRAGGHPSPGLQLAAAGVLLAAGAGADGLPARLARASFGRSQLSALVVVAVTALVPVLHGVSWAAGGADGPVRRGDGVGLPAFVRADLASSSTRSLVLRPRRDGAVGYAVAGADGPRLGRPTADDPALDATVADLLTAGESDAADRLGRRGIRWVALADGDAALAGALDGEPGLSRQAGGPPQLWRVTADVTPVGAGTRETGRAASTVLGLLVLVALAAAHAPARPRTAP